MPLSTPPYVPAEERRLTHLGAAVGSLAHDLQNLLLALRLDAGSICRQLADDHPAQRPAAGLLASLQELDRLADRLGRLSEPALSMVDPSDLLERVARDVRAAAPDAAGFAAEVADGLPPLQCDALLLRLALFHLATDALVHCRGHDRHTVGSVWLRASVRGAGRLRIEVADDGPCRTEPPQGHAEFGRDTGWTVVSRAVRLARGTVERVAPGAEKRGNVVRIELPVA